MAIGLGDAFIKLMLEMPPDTSRKLTGDAQKAGLAAGKALSDSMEKGINVKADGALKGVPEAAKRVGEQAGQNLANSFNTKIKGMAVPKINLNVDTKAALASIDQAKKALDGIASKSATAEVRIRTTDALKELDALKRKIGDVDTTTKSFGDRFKASTDKISSGAATFTKTGAAAGALSASMIAIAPAAGGMVAAFAPVASGLLVVKSGMLAVKAVSAAVKFAAKDVGEAISAGLGDDPKKATEALAKLAPAQRAFAKEAIGMVNSLKPLKSQMGEALFAPMLTGTKALATQIPQVTAKVPALTGAVGAVAGKFAEAAAKSRLINDVKGVIENLTKTVQIAGKNVGVLPALVGAVAAAWGRALPTMAKGVDFLITRIAAMVKAWDEAGKIDKVLQGSLNQLKLFGQLLGNIGSIFVNTFKNMDANGKSLMQTLVNITGRMKEWVKSAEGQEKIRAAFDTMNKVGAAMGSSLGTALKAIGSSLVALAPTAAAMAGTFGELLKAVAPLIPHFTNMANILLRSLIPPMQALAKWMQENEGAAKTLATAIGLTVAATKLYSVTVATVGAVTKAAAVAQALWSGAMGVSTAATGTNTAAIVANRVGLMAHAVATKASTIATAALNLVMRANPFALVVTAIAALVAGIVLLYKNNETARAIIDAAWKAIKTAMSAVVDWFTKTAWPAIKVALDALGTAMKFLWNSVIVPTWNGIKAAISAAWTGIQVVWNAIKTALTALGTAFTWLWHTIIEPVWNGIKAVITTWWAGVQVIWNAVKVALTALGAAFNFLWKNVITPVWNGIKLAISVAWVAIQLIFKAQQVALKVLEAAFRFFWNSVIVPVWNGIKTTIQTTWTAIQAIFNTVITFLKGTFTAAWNAFKLMISTTWTAIKTAIQTTWNFIRDSIFTPIINFLKGTFTVAWNAFKTMLTTTWNAIKALILAAWNYIRDSVFNPTINFLKGPLTSAWNAFKTMLTTLWNAIKSMLQAAWNFIRDNVFNPIINFLKGPLTSGFNTAKTNITNIWTAMKNALKAGWDWIKTNVFTPIANFITKDIPNAFSRGVDMIKSAWDKLKAAVREPVAFVVNTILRDGIVKGFNSIATKVGVSPIEFAGMATGGIIGRPGPGAQGGRPGGLATGGVLPGYTPGRDVHMFTSPTGGALHLSGGEAVMRPEWTRAVGPGFVDTMNRAARQGGSQGVRRAMGMASGGVIRGPIGGSAKEKSTASTLWESITGIANPITGIVNNLLGKIPATGWMLELMKNSVTTLTSGLGKFISSWMGGGGGSSAGGGATPGSNGGPGGWSSMWNWVKERFPSADLYSGYRNSTTLSGNKSLHASGRAIDITPNRAISDAIIREFGTKITELISPWPSDHYWHGSKHTYSRAIQAQHGVFGNNAHIHWAMANGGIVPTYDSGGWLNPGQGGINLGNKPEAVLTPEESTGLKNMGVGELADLLRQLITEVQGVAPGVGGYIRGSGRSLIVGGRSA